MSKWLNNKFRRFTHKEIVKPCLQCNYCPYGQLVEEFPLSKKRTKYSCPIFGHDCPIYYHAKLLR